MKISFILPNIELNGGVKAVFSLSNQLLNLGHDVTVYYPLLPYTGGRKAWEVKHQAARVKFMAERKAQPVKPGWFDLKAPIKRVPAVSDKYLPDADVVVATWWETAYSVKNLSCSKGEKYYFAQHYEVWGGPKKDVDESYRLGLRNIVNSGWLRDILEKDVGAGVEELILHAPDHENFYYEEAGGDDDDILVLMPYRITQDDWKGVEDGLAAFNHVRANQENVRLAVFGPHTQDEVPEHVQAHVSPVNEDLRKLYCRADIFLFPSRVEGFGMPPMEAMACKTCIVSTDVGAVREYTGDGETALISPAGDVDALAVNLGRAVADKELREKLAERGHERIQGYRWENAAKQLEKVFQRNLKG